MCLSAGQFLKCSAFLLSVFVVCSPRPAEMPVWSQLLAQCVTYSNLRGKLHVHAILCVSVCSAACVMLHGLCSFNGFSLSLGFCN